MRFGPGRLPRRRDPRRRFRNRLLLGMVTVALLPLVAFAVLAVFELDTSRRARPTRPRRPSSNTSRPSPTARSTAVPHPSTDNGRDRRDLQEGLTAALTRASRRLPAAGCRQRPARPRRSSSTQRQSAGRCLRGTRPVFQRDERGTAVTQEVTQLLRMNKAITPCGSRTGRREHSASTHRSRASRTLRTTTLRIPRIEAGSACSDRFRGWDARRHALKRVGPAGCSAWLSSNGPFWTDPYPLVEDG